MVLGGQDLESGMLLRDGAAPRHRMSSMQKKAMTAVLVAAVVGVAIVAVAGGFSSALPNHPSELEDIDGKAALRQHASRLRTARGSALQSKFNTLQNKIESDLGMDQEEAVQAPKAPSTAQGLYSWKHAPQGSTSQDARASATLDAARAQDAYHRIHKMWRSASRMHDDVQDHLEQARDDHERIEDEIDEVNEANSRARDALSEAQDTLQEAQYLKHEQQAGAEHTAQAAEFADNAVHAIQNYLKDAFSMAKAVHTEGTEAGNELEGELNSAKSAVSALSQFAEYGNHAALASQHYAAAARMFALHAAGSAQGAEQALEEIETASMQSAFQAIQARYGTPYAQQMIHHAQLGGYWTRHLTDACMQHAYRERYATLPSDPVERAKDLIETMAPILSRAADEIEANEGDCGAIHNVIITLRTSVRPLNEEGNEDKLTAPEITEVQSYAEQALGSTLERLMLEVMKAVQQCGPEVAHKDGEVNPYTPTDNNNDNGDDYVYNRPDDEESPDYNEEDDTQYESGDEASVQTAKQLVDSRAYVISNMISSMRAALTEGQCDRVRAITQHARDDFNYFEKTEMEVMANMPPEDVENVDQYAQAKLMPLLQSSLDEFNAAKEKCGREIFSDMPEGPSGDEIPSGGVIEDGDKIAESEEGGKAEAESSSSSDEDKDEDKSTALTVAAKAVIDHMATDISTLMNQIEADPSDCKGAEAAGVEFKAKFKALEHIAEGYEERMSPEEKAVSEQYAEDTLGDVMQQLFTAVMHTSAHCGPSAFTMDGGQDVEDFYDDQERDTISERDAAANGLVEPAADSYDEQSPDAVIVNPDAERHVAAMKDRVAELKKRLEKLRKKFGGSSSGASGKASGAAASAGGKAAASAGGKAAAGKAAAAKPAAAKPAAAAGKAAAGKAPAAKPASK